MVWRTTIGDLRERITIRRVANVKNSRGGLDRSWSTVAEVAAEVRSVNGREAVIGQVLQGVSVFQIVIRFRSDVQSADQILWRGRELNISAAEDREGRRTWLTIIASTEAPQGA